MDRCHMVFSNLINTKLILVCVVQPCTCDKTAVSVSFHALSSGMMHSMFGTIIIKISPTQMMPFIRTGGRTLSYRHWQPWPKCIETKNHKSQLEKVSKSLCTHFHERIHTLWSKHRKRGAEEKVGQWVQRTYKTKSKQTASSWEAN